VFVNLLDNPERFTGYAGTSASRVWKSIYEENCFNVVSHIDPINNNNFASSSTSKNQLGNILQNVVRRSDTTDNEEVCFEKRVYYRLISGTLFFYYFYITGSPIIYSNPK
jgi:ERO1-like protein beta